MITVVISAKTIIDARFDGQFVLKPIADISVFVSQNFIRTEAISAAYQNIKIYVEGKLIDPRDAKGNVYHKAQQVARCGNAVCPPMAAAMVRANMPQWCEGVNISTMEELKGAVAI